MSKFKPNEKQQQCINNIEGKHLILAGPGTGKTFTLIEIMKAILAKGINPEKILALTFSDAAANEMKNRLDKELQEMDSGVYISTYHSFCLDIIKDNPEEFELPANYKVITDTVSRNFLKECIKELEPKAFRTEKNDPYFYLDEIYRKIQDIKSHRLTKDEYFRYIKENPDWEPELLKAQAKLKDLQESGEKIPATAENNVKKAQKNIDKAYELRDFYELYKSKTEAEHYIDFNDMINFVLDKFDTDPSFLEDISNKYEYLLVDEYQDTNNPQNEIVTKITQSMKDPNVIVVGDDDQIIYTFQGAKLDTMEKFIKNFPDTEIFCLTDNMRSTQSILNAARAVAIQDNNRLEANLEFRNHDICKKLTAKNPDIIKLDKPVRIYKYNDVIQEYAQITQEIENLINSDTCPVNDKNEKKLSEIAILTTTNAELDTFAQLLKEKNIPYELKDGKNIFLIKSSYVLYCYLKMLTSPELYSDKIFKLLLMPPFSINSKDYETLFKQHSRYKTFIDAMKCIDKKEFVQPEKIMDFVLTFDYLQSYRANETLKNIVLETGAKTGIFDYFINSEINRSENIAGLKKIADEAINFSQVTKSVSLEYFVEYLDMAYNDEFVIKTDKAPVTLNAVQLLTYHSSKGKEFEYVYMPTLTKDKWESSSKSYKAGIPLPPSEYKTKDELLEIKYSDNIKLLYVGMTRAKHTLRLSYPQTVAGKEKKLTRYISNIIDDKNLNFEKKEAPEFDAETYWLERTKDLIIKDYDYTKEFHELVNSKINGKPYSPTSVNTYIKCPRMYFYKYILDFEAKDGNADNMHYGTSVHYALEKAVNYAMKNHAYPTKEKFIKYFDDKLSTLPVSSFEASEILKGRGEAALDKYYVQLCNTPVNMLCKPECEIHFTLGDIRFRGIIDRIEKNPDGTFSVYDYKTGSAKNGRIICTGGEHEDYYNQIALYKYFFEKSHECKVKSVGFIFPEDFENNYDPKITDEDCLEVVDKFKNAISNIKAYNFEPIAQKDRKNSPACKYCAYKDFCNFDVV
ncbi:MAG: ATP-dependent DNA helicase [Cyanobacteriota bacterium]|nr:ATP-dependent DNA helicase [Cyanobacteriota bacterium]